MLPRPAIGALVAVAVVLGAGSSAAWAQTQATGGTGGGGTTAAPAGEGGGFSNSIITSVTRTDLSEPDQGFYGLNLPQQVIYTGIIPNVRDWLPHLRNNPLIWQRYRHRRNLLTWIGFQRFNDRTRVFIQTGVPAAYSMVRGNDGKINIILENTASTLSNWHRNMDTRWFPRSIEGIKARRMRGRRVAVEIDLRVAANVNVTTEGNYIYVDFDDSSLEQAVTGVPVTAPGKGTVYDGPDN